MGGLDWRPIIRAASFFGFLEAIAGVFTSGCLLGIAISRIFAYLFCALLLLFSIVFGIVAWLARDDGHMRILAISGSILMAIAGVSSVFVDPDFFVNGHALLKIPFFMLVSGALFINFTINISKVVKWLHCHHMKDRLLTNPTQINVLLILNLLIGMILGIIFGLLEPEETSAPKWDMAVVTALYFIVGMATGVGFGVYNEYQTQKLQLPLESLHQSLKSSDFDQM
jgi:hypothetical protein